MPTKFKYLAQAIDFLEQEPLPEEESKEEVIEEAVDDSLAEGNEGVSVAEEDDEPEWEMLDLKTIAEVKACADGLVELNDTLHHFDDEQLKMAINLFTALSNLICQEEELAPGLEAWHVRSYSDALFQAEEYREAYDLLCFIQDYPHMYPGITSGQIAELMQVIFDDLLLELYDDDDGDVLDAKENFEDVSEDFFSAMNIVCDVPQWRKDIPPELWMEEYELLEKKFDYLVKKKSWCEFVDEMDCRRHRSLIIDVLAGHHLPVVIEGLIKDKDKKDKKEDLLVGIEGAIKDKGKKQDKNKHDDEDPIIRMENLLDMATDNASDVDDHKLTKHISPEHREQIIDAIIQRAAKDLKINDYEQYLQRLFGTENLPKIYEQLSNDQFMNALAVSLNAEFKREPVSEEGETFISELMAHHPVVFQKLKAVACNLPYKPTNDVPPAGGLVIAP